MQLCDQLTTATCLSTDPTGTSSAGNSLLHRHHNSSLSTSKKMFSSISWIHVAFTCVCLLISHLPLHRCQVLNGPLLNTHGTSISVQEGEVATFSCEIDCSNDGLSWFVGIDDKTYGVGAFINHLKLIGIDAEMQVNDAACDAGEEGDSRNKTSMLTIVTSAMLDRAPVQCASSCLVSSCLCGGSNAIFRSPFAILRVESDTTPATTVPPMPASSSSSAFPQPTSSSSVAMMAATSESRTSSSTTQQTLCQPTLDPTMKPGIPVVETEPISEGTATEASGINLKDAFTIGFPAGVSVGLIMGFLLAVLMFFCTSLSRRAKQMNGHSIELSMETCRETPKENVYVDGPSHTKSASAAAMPVPSISPSPAPAPHAQAQAPSQLARHPMALAAAAPHPHPHPHPQAQTLPPPPQQQQQLLPPPSSATASYVSLTQL